VATDLTQSDAVLAAALAVDDAAITTAQATIDASRLDAGAIQAEQARRAASVLQGPIDFSGKTNVTVSGSDAAHLLTVAAPKGGNAFIFDTASKGIAIRNVAVISDGTGQAANLKGQVTLDHVALGNLALGFVSTGANLTITALSQTDRVIGQALFISGGSVLWDGRGLVLGPSPNESPVRFSSPPATVTMMNVTVVQMPPAKACFALHDGTFTANNCLAEGGDFSIASMQNSPATAAVTGTFTGIQVRGGGKLLISDVARCCTFISPVCDNPTGECVSITCHSGAGNVIDGGKFSTESNHAVKIYLKGAGIKIKNCVLTTHNKNAVMIDDGTANVSQYDGGGNKIVILV
jgi:hypothetical protein